MHWGVEAVDTVANAAAVDAAIEFFLSSNLSFDNTILGYFQIAMHNSFLIFL